MSNKDNNSRHYVPIWEKYLLTIPEAAKYFGFSAIKLREITSERPDAEYIYWNGTRAMINRKVLEKYIDEGLF